MLGRSHTPSWASRCSQNGLRRHKDGPESLQDATRGLQEYSKTVKEAPKIRQKKTRSGFHRGKNCPTIPAPFLRRTCTGQPPSRGIVGGVFRSVFLDRTWTYFYACFPQMSVSPDTSLQHGDLEGRRACPQVDGTMSVGGGTRGKHEERGTSGRTESGRASFEISGLN